MSRARGLFPLVVAVAFGIGNGIYVFYPSLKEQQLEKQGLLRQEFEDKHQDEAAIQAVKAGEAKAGGNSVVAKIPDLTTSVFNETNSPSGSSWWSSLNDWASKTPAPDVRLREAGFDAKDSTIQAKLNDEKTVK